MNRSNRRFGIELEFECPWEYLKKHAQKHIQKVYGPRKSYSKNDSFESNIHLDKWHIKVDGLSTISELTTPVSTQKDLKLIGNVVGGLQQCELNPSESCGFHVHIDIPDIDMYHFMASWMISERAIFSCFPLDRRKSSYCQKINDQPNASRSFISRLLEEKVDTSGHTDAVSFSNYEERKTVEIRIAEATDDPEFVVNWIEFLLYWIDYTKQQNPSLLPCRKCNSMSFEDLLEDIPMKKSVVQFMRKRYEKYSRMPYWVY